jgi:hypothetical protein
MPKKTATAKKASAKTKTTGAKRGPGRPKGSTSKKTAAAPAKRGPGRPKGSTNKSTAKKSTASRKNTKTVSKPKGSGRGGFHRELNEETGFVVGTDQDTIALALLEGGESRSAIAEAVEKKIGSETRNGTPKMVTNMVSGVLNKMLDRGFTVEQSFQVIPPTPASKRAASRKRKK